MRTKIWMTSIAVAAAALLVTVPGLAQERDSDGTRMQARQVEVGTVHSDRLAPPEEDADWRMVQFKDDDILELELTVETEGRTATLTLTEATGEQLEADTAGEEPAEIRRNLGAGIYYIAVESSDALEYELVID